MTVDSKRNRLAVCGGQVAQFAVGVDDGAFVGGDGVGSVLERGADVVDGGLAVSTLRDVASKRTSARAAASHSRNIIRSFNAEDAEDAEGSERKDVRNPSGIGDPSQAARGDSGDAVGNAVVLAQFRGTVGEQADESPVDVAVAEEAEVVCRDGGVLDGGGFKVSESRFQSAAGYGGLKPRHLETLKLATLQHRNLDNLETLKPCHYPITVVCSGEIL